MAIEYRDREAGGPKVVMVECPVCGEDLRGRPASYHVADHRPEDFGLSPLGEIADRHDRPTAVVARSAAP